MKKHTWFRERCNGCKSYNPECQQGVCCLEKNIKKVVLDNKDNSS